jgi:uncharacterized membrane protein YphA (DoxX/SURF4 family)
MGRIFLVLLRIVIGWHILVEGLHKFDVPWSSEAYLRESSGPLSPVFHDLSGDSLADKLTLLPPQSPSADDVESTDRFPPALARDWNEYRDRFVGYYHIEDARQKELRDSVNGAFGHAKSEFVHWAVTGTGGPVVVSPITGVKAEFKQPLDQRLQDYADQHKKVVRLQSETLRPSFEADKATHGHAEKQLSDAKRELALTRSSLQDDVRRQTHMMEDSLLKVVEQDADRSGQLTMPEPSRLPWQDWSRRESVFWFGYWAMIVLAAWGLVGLLVSLWRHVTPSRGIFWLVWFGIVLAASSAGAMYVFGTGWWQSWRPFEASWHTLACWAKVAAGVAWVGALVLVVLEWRSGRSTQLSRSASLALGAVGMLTVAAVVLFFGQPWIRFSRLEWTDGLVTWGLVTIGACLLAGFWTRTAAVVGAVMLLSFWLAMPPLPWLPAPPNAEGHYLWINKNVIEAIALLVLATTAVGQWAGIDGILRFALTPQKQKRPVPTPIDDDVIQVAPAPSEPVQI